ncbi:MAG TPA: SigE family RNA polymerase sigma factor [Micromonosporaceae bacterium]|nr:SigE family RNA polymerase sigma factor [Micromonosporaceae bacterium]
MARPQWESEFTEYFTARAPTMRRLAYALCGDWHTADDLLQTTFVRLYPQWGRVDTETVDAYTRRILVNVYLSHRRRRWWESLMSQPPDRPAAPPPDLGERLLVHWALARLAPGQRAMVVLRHLEELSVAEVAELLGVSEGTVKSQTARGLQSLRATLTEPAFVGEECHHA